jgi:hypothetical protein
LAPSELEAADLNRLPVIDLDDDSFRCGPEYGFCIEITLTFVDKLSYGRCALSSTAKVVGFRAAIGVIADNQLAVYRNCTLDSF